MREIQVINLEKRTDRWQCIIKLFDGYNLKRFNAIEMSPAWKGCAMSHIGILQESKKLDKDYVIVMEDDVALFDKPSFKEKFEEIMNYLDDNLDKWDIFQFGTTYSEVGKNDNVHYINNDLGIIEYQFGLTASFIIYNKTVYDKMISTKDSLNVERDNINDVIMNNFGFRMWTTIPFLAYQKDGFSDLQGRNMSYKYFFEKNESYLKNKIN